MASLDAEIHSQARGEYQTPAIFHRSLRPQRGLYERFNHIFLLTEGAVRLTLANETQELRGPASVYLPALPEFSLSISAGSNSYLVGLAPGLMVDAIGNKPESVLLRIFTERPGIVRDLENPRLEEIQALTIGFIRELEDPDRGSWMAISAYFRLILMAIWRSGDIKKMDERGHGEVSTILQSFRQLVEVHFREHWPIGDYANELGVTYDRLHSICDRTLSKSPLQLVHNRVIQEAILRLDRSGSTIQEISDSLGFSDPTYFSHFFKRNAGQSPAVHRRQSRAQTSQQKETFISGFADWP